MRDIEVSSDVMERIGQLSDKADNYHGASRLPFSPRIHLDALSGGMLEIRDELRAIFIEVTGENPWEFHPK